MNEGHDESNRRVTPWLLRVAQVVVMFFTTVLLGVHVFKLDTLRVDGIMLALLGLLLVIPLADVIRKIKLGEFEAEIGREEVARVHAKAATELAPARDVSTGASFEERVLELVQEDPRLALAKVRIELEEGLKRLFCCNV